MKYFTILLGLLISINISQAQDQKLIPQWKVGETWKMSSLASLPSDSKKVDENGNLLMDTLQTVFNFKVETELEDGFVMSIQLLEYSNTNDDDDEVNKELNGLIAGAKQIEPLFYLITKDGSLKKEENDLKSKDGLSGMIAMATEKVDFLNDSLIVKYFDNWTAAKKSITESEDKAYLESNSNEIEVKIDEATNEDTGESTDESEPESDEMDEDDESEDNDFLSKMYLNLVRSTFSDRIEKLHTPYGTEIKQVNTPYSIEDISAKELNQLQLNPEMLKMFKINGTYLFRNEDGKLIFESDLSMDMKDMLVMMVKAFEDAFKDEGDEGGKKKKKKAKTEEQKPKPSEQIPSMEMGMKSQWIFDEKAMTPLKYIMLITTKMEEKGEKFSFEAEETILFEKL